VAARGTAPVVGVVVLLAIGLALGGVVAAGAEAVATATGQELGSEGTDAPRIAVSLRVDGDTVALTHEAGPDLRISRVRLVVAVDGTPLAHQPPVPFFAAEGFRAGPTGPFNVASDGTWTAGETGSLRVASTNDPLPEPGRTVSVRGSQSSASALASAAASAWATASSASSASGARAIVVIARGVPGLFCWMWCSMSTKPASSNIRWASVSS